MCIRDRYDLAYIRNTIDTTDPFYEQEMSNFYKEIGELSLLGQQAEEAVLRSPYKSGIEEKFGPLPLRDMETGLKLMSPNVVEDMTEESRPVSYTHLIFLSMRTVSSRILVR